MWLTHKNPSINDTVQSKTKANTTLQARNTAELVSTESKESGHKDHTSQPQDTKHKKTGQNHQVSCQTQ